MQNKIKNSVEKTFASGEGFSRWFILTFLVFIVVRSIALILHYFGDSPYGGPLLVSPNRFIMNAIVFEFGIYLAYSIAFVVFLRIIRLSFAKIRILYLIFSCLFMILAQIDSEIMRWMSQHLSLSYIKNYFRSNDASLLFKMIANDLPATLTALGIMIVYMILPFFLKRKKYSKNLSYRAKVILGFITIITITSPLWLMQSDKRYRRIEPVAWGLTREIVHDIMGFDEPQNPDQAMADLLEYVENGKLSTQKSISTPEYPLLQASGPGKIPDTLWRKQDQSQRPNIIYVIFETWRGWETGLVDDSSRPSHTPQLDSLIKNEAFYFPYVHSPGFPSVEGAVGIHLGVWTHFRDIFACRFSSIKTRSLTEIFRDQGYRTEVLIGTDPSFDNLTSWFRRWYEYLEYSEKYGVDGPLMDRFISMLDTIDQTKPYFLTTWNVTTHPPYEIPKSEGIPIAKTSDARFQQAIRYSEKQIIRLVDYLKKSGKWDNTILVITGDHAQPSIKVRRNDEIAGAFTPGHTWVHSAILGGWKGLPAPKRNNHTINQIDIAPTLLNIVNLSTPNHFMGHSQLQPKAREFLSFRWNKVAVIRENQRILFSMLNDKGMWMPINKQSKRDYALLEGHKMKLHQSIPSSFPLTRYKDMIRMYGQILENDKLFPKQDQKMGVYKHIK